MQLLDVRPFACHVWPLHAVAAGLLPSKLSVHKPIETFPT